MRPFSVNAHCQIQQHPKEKSSPGNWTQPWHSLPITMIQSWTRKSFPTSSCRSAEGGVQGSQLVCLFLTIWFYLFIFIWLVTIKQFWLWYWTNAWSPSSLLSFLSFFFFFYFSIKLHFPQMNWKRIMVRKGQRRDECVLQLHTDLFFP